MNKHSTSWQKNRRRKNNSKNRRKETKEISSSQMSYDNRLDNLEKLIKLLASVTLYAPNEEALQVATLTSLYTDLQPKNTDVVSFAIRMR